MFLYGMDRGGDRRTMWQGSLGKEKLNHPLSTVAYLRSVSRFRVEGGGREQREKDEGADPPLLTCVESGDTDFWSRRWVWVSEG